MAETSKTVAQALRLLVMVGEREGSTSELARRAGMHRSIVQRLLTTLREQGFVFRKPDGRYVLGSTIRDLAVGMADPVRIAALEPMRELAERVNETVVLAIRDGDNAVSAEQISAVGHLVRAEYPAGFQHPLARAAAGRAILSAADPETLARTLKASAEPRLLERELEDVRSRGYAVSYDELGLGAAGIAAAVIGSTGYAVASVGVITPLARFPAPESIADAVMITALAISQRLAG